MDPPSRIIIGRKSRHKISLTDIFCDFLEAFAHCVVRRCARESLTFEEIFFGDFCYKKYCDLEFEKHVDEMVMMSRKYFLAKRLHIFEVAIVQPSEEQLIGFRICLNYLEVSSENTDDNLYEKLTKVLESVQKIELNPNVEISLNSCKFRPRIRLLIRLRSESRRQIDTSNAPYDHNSFPISDSITLPSNFLTFYGHA